MLETPLPEEPLATPVGDVVPVEPVAGVPVEDVPVEVVPVEVVPVVGVDDWITEPGRPSPVVAVCTTVPAGPLPEEPVPGASEIPALEVAVDPAPELPMPGLPMPEVPVPEDARPEVPVPED
ncbi:MAG TPA: hypothetical protein VMD28_05595, partial [Acidimicrobiales bacterium]|nr:hypothetical protein [Acidimicrobiales bacterium]